MARFCEYVKMPDGSVMIVCGSRPRPRKKATVNFPATKEELQAAGWSLRQVRNCRLCGVRLEFWRTLSGKLMPLEQTMVEGFAKYVSHWATCPHASEFRAPKPLVRAKIPPIDSPKDEQPKLF